MCPKSNRHKACNHFPKITVVLTETEMGPMGLLVWTPLISRVLMLPRQQHLTKINYKSCQNKTKNEICHWTKQQQQISFSQNYQWYIMYQCSTLYRASGILLITMQLYLFNFFARFECVFHANKNILWFISLKSFLFL